MPTPAADAGTYTLPDLISHLERLGWEPKDSRFQELTHWRHPQVLGEKITTPNGTDAEDEEILADYIAAAADRLTILHRSRRLEDLRP